MCTWHTPIKCTLSLWKVGPLSENHEQTPAVSVISAHICICKCLCDIWSRWHGWSSEKSSSLSWFCLFKGLFLKLFSFVHMCVVRDALAHVSTVVLSRRFRVLRVNDSCEPSVVMRTTVWSSARAFALLTTEPSHVDVGKWTVSSGRVAGALNCWAVFLAPKRCLYPNLKCVLYRKWSCLLHGRSPRALFS